MGVCPDELGIVTRYEGPIFDRRCNDLPLEQRVSIALQIARVCGSLHAAGFTHNDIKRNNLCVETTSTGPVVTLIDFGMAYVSGRAMAVKCSWREGLHYAPEICKNATLGRCSSLSGVYSLGQVLWPFFEAHETPWFEASESMSPSERQGLRVLIECLEAEQDRLAG